ncbi:hypothetical protein BDZ91DRAFT_649342 [Kalaharituber pfeilii]|nr:hypothetical protein BDZ91DRAFT_649342 [Kalaharituber pfeilii]
MGDSDSERTSTTVADHGLPQTHKVQEQPTANTKKEPKKQPKTLIELPVDVLKEIVKEVNNTNDLVSLALTCRCLHALSIPHIYSRFDIVWPDSNTVGDRSGVDALTYGLSTLVASGRRGNDYARWIKKFSLGNGPADWVGEYNISKEGGKMLGTLVNLAIMRMQSLETFNWDMPTGVLRDIFMSLHDLCPQSLKNIHVRFHDNSDTTAPLSQDPSRRVETPTFKGFKALRQLSVLDVDERQYLEEMAYAVEESVDTLKELRIGLAEHVSKTGKWIWDLDEGPGDVVDVVLRSGGGSAVGGVLGIVVSRICELNERRRKLRGEPAGIVPAAIPSATAANPSATAPNLSPTLGIPEVQQPTGIPGGNVPLGNATTALMPVVPTVSPNDDGYEIFNTASLSAALPPPQPAVATGEHIDAEIPSPIPSLDTQYTNPVPSQAQSSKLGKDKTSAPVPEDEKPYKQLKLETLDLERVPLSVRVLQKVIDWTVLTNLTILNCPNHERLWKTLRRKFSPFYSNAAAPLTSSSYLKPTLGAHYSTGSKSARRLGTSSVPGVTAPDYRIQLKKLHTDLVSPSLIAFIKETLPPNSLEVLFLQENPQQSATPTGYSSPVAIDSIFKYCIKRHRCSLRKLLVDSNVGSTGQYESDKWRFNREVIGFITTHGKMPKLRELGCAIDYKDWHYFLTRLPGLAGLRSLYLPHVKGAVQLPQAVCREMALQIVDVVSLRNEVEICYVGVMTKCFELLEGKDIDADGAGDGIGLDDDMEVDEEDESEEDEDEENAGAGEGDEEEEEGSDEEEDEFENAAGAAGGSTNIVHLSTGVKDDESGDEAAAGLPHEHPVPKDADRVRVRLREILFYDDKVAVFKARSGKL